jgi:hypothetical protein
LRIFLFLNSLRKIGADSFGILTSGSVSEVQYSSKSPEENHPAYEDVRHLASPLIHLALPLPTLGFALPKLGFALPTMGFAPLLGTSHLLQQAYNFYHKASPVS